VKSLLDDVVSEVAGEEVVRLAQVLKKNKNVSEFKLTTLLKQDINLTRNMLYKLYELNLVSFTRKKDKKKGWYIYYWTLNEKQFSHVRKELLKQRVDRLRERIDRERNSQFFLCPTKCVRLDFDQATEFSFKCPECNELLSIEDNAKKIQELDAQIQSLENELKPVPEKKKRVPAKKIVKSKKKKRC